jgi:hypothetical protein
MGPRGKLGTGVGLVLLLLPLALVACTDEQTEHPAPGRLMTVTTVDRCQDVLKLMHTTHDSLAFVGVYTHCAVVLTPAGR